MNHNGVIPGEVVLLLGLNLKGVFLESHYPGNNVNEYIFILSELTALLSEDDY